MQKLPGQEASAENASTIPQDYQDYEEKATVATANQDWNGDFLGGPPHLFERAGREQLLVLLEHGFQFNSTVLDIGCGCLRGGRWIIPLLERGHYCAIEPQEQMVRKGLQQFVDPEVVAFREPRFDYNDRFDFSVFNMKFTHFMARSIWTHASKQQIELMLDGVVAWGEANCVLLTSFLPTRFFRRRDYRGTGWVGRSHESEESGMVAHDFAWIERASRERGLVVQRLARPPLENNQQIWAAISKA